MTTLTTRFTLAACNAELAEDTLTFSNARMTRRWRVDESGLLYPLSFCAGENEWFARQLNVPAPQPAFPLPKEPRAVRLVQSQEAPLPFQAPSLTLDLVAEGAALTLGYRFQIFPEVCGVSVRCWHAWRSQPAAAAPVPASAPAATATGVEDADRAALEKAADVVPGADLLERFDAAGPHLRLLQVSFQDCTDEHNELVLENEWLLQLNERNLALRGNLFVIENTLTGDGLVFLKEAPLPHARPMPDACDARFFGKNHVCAFYGHGLEPDAPPTTGVPSSDDMGYRHILLAYSQGVTGRTQALHAYQRCLRTFDSTRDGLTLSNTWGDRNRDGRVSAEFMFKEVDAGARLGIDIIQIDDGWQKGVTSGSVHAQSQNGVWGGWWAANPDFWGVHPERFPQGLKPLIDAARQKGMQFGLWFSPDSPQDYANWKKDAETVLRLHREYGVNYFKIDGVTVSSRKGERNLRRFFNMVLRDSGGRVVFDFDITAGVRPGYWGLTDTGPLFVENRYTDWRCYWPHQTLRNLWKLSHYVDPLRLRMEFLNSARNTAQYDGDPLAPHTYPPEYLLATVLGCNPLAWCELSQLPQEYAQGVEKLAAVWKAHRRAFFSGTVIPVGDAPDGTSWTGFVSIGAQAQSGYLLLFREKNTQPDWTTDLRMFAPEPFNTTVLAGMGKVTFRNHHLRANIPVPQNFVLARVEMIPR